jgi:hypothetical protein
MSNPDRPITIYIDIKGGNLQSIYGDDLPLPEDTQIMFVLRDHDNIECGDHDPYKDESADYKPVYYW